MSNIIKTCKDRQEQLDLLNEILSQQPDYVFGMNIMVTEYETGEVEWLGDTAYPNSEVIYTRVLKENLHKLQLA